jgi:4-hydroxy-2-oxoheptanedioate aldolase
VKLGDKGIALGGWCTIPSSFTIEVMSRAGFDWLCFDLQHTMIDLTTAMSMLQATAISSVPTFVRTSSYSPAELQHMLDAGAAGVVVPMVNNANEARDIVQACKYPPEGRRSWGPYRAEFMMPDYSTRKANEEIICGAMIETLEGLEHLDEIVKVEGVDLVLVGPGDLAIAMGLPPRQGLKDDHFRTVLGRIAERCLEAGVTPAIQGRDVAGSLQVIELGYRMVLVGTDAKWMASGAAETLRAVRNSVKSLVVALDGNLTVGAPRVATSKGGESQ